MCPNMKTGRTYFFAGDYGLLTSLIALESCNIRRPATPPPSQIQFVLMFCLQISHSAFPVGRRTLCPRFLSRAIIRPLFRDVDYSHMEPHGIKLDDYTFMSDPDNASKCSKHFRRTKATRLPCTRRALLDSGPARVVRPVAETRATSLSPRSRAAEGLRLERDKAGRCRNFACSISVGLRCLRENRDAVVTRWLFAESSSLRCSGLDSPNFVQRFEANFTSCEMSIFERLRKE